MSQPIKPFAYIETKAAWATAPKSAWEHIARVANTIAKAILETFSSLFTVVKNWLRPTPQAASFVPAAVVSTTPDIDPDMPELEDAVQPNASLIDVASKVIKHIFDQPNYNKAACDCDNCR